MITPKALAVCIFAAAHTYAMPPSVILGMLNVEGGRIGEIRHNADNTDNLGPMQINTVWIPEVARHLTVSEDKAFRALRDDACVNIEAGTWILSREIDESYDINKAIEKFHEVNPDSLHISGRTYDDKVVVAMEKYNLIHKPEDLLGAPMPVSAETVSPTATETNDVPTEKTQDNSETIGSIVFSIILLPPLIYLLVHLGKIVFREYVCTKCGTIGCAKTNSSSVAWLITIFLYLFFIVPGLLCTVLLLSIKKKVCGVCGSPEIIPTNTPIGRAMVQKLTGVEAPIARSEKKGFLIDV